MFLASNSSMLSISLPSYMHTLMSTHSNKDYIKYKKSTPPLIPGIPPLYRITPYLLKLIFCCEFPFYNFLQSEMPRPILHINPYEDQAQYSEYTEDETNDVELDIGSMSNSVPTVTPPSSIPSRCASTLNRSRYVQI